jgi:hypothetical protein
MTQDRDFVSVRGIAVRHTTAARDWVCGECGSRLVTRYIHDSDPTQSGWRTICHNEPKHSSDNFVHKNSWAYIEHRKLKEAAQAQDVFSHLPAELQAAIEGTE